MKTVARLAAVLLIAMVAISAAPLKDWKTIRFATEGGYPPFNWVDETDTPQGFDVEIARALCERARAKCVFSVESWEGLIPALLAKKVDAIVSAMPITEERRARVDFTDRYSSTAPRFITRRHGEPEEIRPETMRGHTLGAQAGTLYATYLETVYAPAGATIRTFATLAEAAEKLASGDIDALLADRVSLFDWIENHAGRCCRFNGPDVADTRFFGDGNGIALRRDDKELKALLNKALADIVRDGTYERINSRFFAFAID